MASIFSVHLGHVTPGASGDFLLGTSALQGVTVVRDLVAAAAGTGVKPLSFYWLASGGQPVHLCRDFIKDGESFHRDLRQVIPPGVQIRVACDEVIHSATVSGYLLG